MMKTSSDNAWGFSFCRYSIEKPLACANGLNLNKILYLDYILHGMC